jgi:hypothetical protein
MKYETITYSIMVKPVGEPIFSEQGTKISLEDEAAGAFVSVEQHGGPAPGKILLIDLEWPMIRDAIDRLMVVCKKLEEDESK